MFFINFGARRINYCIRIETQFRWFLAMQQWLVRRYIQYSVFHKNIFLGSRTFTSRQAINRSMRTRHKLENSPGVFQVFIGKTKRIGESRESTNLYTHFHSAFGRTVHGKNGIAEVSTNLSRYRFENNFVRIIKI